MADDTKMNEKRDEMAIDWFDCGDEENPLLFVIVYNSIEDNNIFYLLNDR